MLRQIVFWLLPIFVGANVTKNRGRGRGLGPLLEVSLLNHRLQI